jgi:two-component system alkaline phosphatase synthesis response regulator PhoP
MQLHVFGDASELVQDLTAALRQAGHVVQVETHSGPPDNVIVLIASRTEVAASAVPALSAGEATTQPDGRGQLKIALDPDKYVVERGSKQVQLTPTEFRLLEVLASEVGHVVPYARLIEAVWGHAGETSSALVKSHISRLRMKLSLLGERWGAIQAVQGAGYRLTP